MEEDRWPSDHASAAARIANHLPSDDQGLTPIGEGDFCLAFRRGANVVRVAKHREAADALRMEACAMERIAPHLPFPVPQPSFAEPAPGCAFSIHAEVTGEELTREIWESLPSDARDAAAADLARFLDALHALRIPNVETCGIPRIDAAEYAARLHAASAPLRSLLPADTFRRLDAALSRGSQPSTEPDLPASLLHRDVAPGHVLFDPSTGRLTGVIDFGDLALGDPARDFIYVYEDFGPEMLDAVLRHYTGEDAATLRPRIHRWFLLETVEWALGLDAEEEADEVEEACTIIANESGQLLNLLWRDNRD